MTMTVTGRVTATQRHGHTINGNPMMSVQLDGAEWYRISNDAGLVYEIDNSYLRDMPHTYILTPAGRISRRVR